MAGPANARSTRSGRYYTHPITQETATSVTTILGAGVPKPALIGWAAKATAEHAVENIERLAKMVQAGGMKGRAQALDELKSSRFASRDTKADIGTAVHDVAEAMGLDPDYHVDLDSYEPEVQPYLLGLERFWREWRPEVLAAEMTVWNRTYAYAGTLDNIFRVRFHGEDVPVIAISDYKTSKGVYPEVGLQMSAYAHAEFGLLDDGSEVELPGPITDGMVVHLQPASRTKDGWGVGRYSVHKVDVSERIFRAFLYAREVAYWQNTLSKDDVISVPQRPPYLNQED